MIGIKKFVFFLYDRQAFDLIHTYMLIKMTSVCSDDENPVVLWQETS